MIEIKNWEDFKSQYQGTYIYLKNEVTGELLSCYVREVSTDNKILWLDKEEGKTLTVPNGYPSLTLAKYFPRSGLYNIDSDVRFVSRKVGKHFHRGITKNNLSIEYPFAEIFRYLLPEYYPGANSWIDTEFLNKVVKRQYPRTLDNAIAKLNTDDQIGVAINQIFCITYNPTTEHGEYILYKNMTPVGFIDKNYVSVVAEEFCQEVNDMLKRKESLRCIKLLQS